MTDGLKIDISLKAQLGSFDLDVAFQAPTSGITVLFGPSGCGKTSILRAIAGLNHLQGKIIIGEHIWQNEQIFIPVHKRKIGYIFQESSLFSHLNVFKNLTYAFDKKAQDADAYFKKVIDMLGIADLIARSPKNLSGGERQKVAIGRALLSSPDILLLDEPLSALDMAMRAEILPFIEHLRDQFQLPIFYVTHDIYEVERLADHLILLEGGKILSAGNLQDLQADINLPLALARNSAVNLDAKIINWEQKTGICTLNVNGGQFFTPLAKKPKKNTIRIRIGASDVSLSLRKPKATSILNSVEAVIIEKKSLNPYEVLLSLKLDDNHYIEDNGQGAHILCRLSQYSWQNLRLTIGMKIFAQVKGIALLSD